MTEAESVPQDARSEMDRVLAYVNDCNEGVSCISASIGTGIRRSAVESILKSLIEEHAINSAWSTKGGYCMYYPCPEPRKAITRPRQKDRLSAYERKLDAGEIPAPDPDLDRASPDRFPSEEKPSNKCRYCGEVKEKYLWQHENYCKENPDHKTPPGVASKRRKERTEKTSTPVDNMVPDIALDPPGSERQLTEGPAPIDESVPPLGECNLSVVGCQDGPRVVETVNMPPEYKDLPQRPLVEEFVDRPTPRPGGILNVIGCCEPKADPLALFAQQHRLRINKEIRKLRKVEGKLRRRAAAAETMADRVHAARRTKERELRRFEREMEEARQ